MEHTESEYINSGFTLERRSHLVILAEEIRQKINLMLDQETDQDRPEAVRLINIGKAEGRRWDTA